MLITEAFAVYEARALVERTEKTKKNYCSCKNSITRVLGDVHLELIGEEQLLFWRQNLVQEGMTGTTQRGYIISFRSVLKYFTKAGKRLIDISEIELPKKDTKPRPYIRAEEVTKLIAAAKNERDKAILACTFLAGCRISEILNLNREDLRAPVDVDGLQEVFVIGKGEKHRPVYFNDVARKYLDGYLKTRDDAFHELFISGQNRRITVSRVEQIVHECTRKSGIDKHVTPHTLRHSYATDLLNNGASLYQVSKTMGHANISTTSNIYGHFDSKERRSTLIRHQTRIT